jgi:hypothetical protein
MHLPAKTKHKHREADKSARLIILADKSARLIILARIIPCNI